MLRHTVTHGRDPVSMSSPIYQQGTFSYTSVETGTETLEGFRFSVAGHVLQMEG